MASSLQELVAAVEQAPSLALMILAAEQLARQLAILLVQEVLTQRAQQPTEWPTLRQAQGSPRESLPTWGVSHQKLF